jgi:hypothetical protein
MDMHNTHIAAYNCAIIGYLIDSGTGIPFFIQKVV